MEKRRKFLFTFVWNSQIKYQNDFVTACFGQKAYAGRLLPVSINPKGFTLAAQGRYLHTHALYIQRPYIYKCIYTL
jgi:hypothetical protein